MSFWTKRTARAALFAAGFATVAAGGGFASADTTDGRQGAVGGNQVSAPISVPIDISGNSASIFGNADAKAPGGAHVDNHGGSGGGLSTSGKEGVGSGNQYNQAVSIPINVCGNAFVFGGFADAMCKGSATVDNAGNGKGMGTSGADGWAGGNQVSKPFSMPVNICGNARAVFGIADAWCNGGAYVENKGSGSHLGTSGHQGIGAGGQHNAPVSAPFEMCGNSSATLGIADAACKGTATVVNAAPWGRSSASGKTRRDGDRDWSRERPGRRRDKVVDTPLSRPIAGLRGFTVQMTSMLPELVTEKVARPLSQLGHPARPADQAGPDGAAAPARRSAPPVRPGADGTAGRNAGSGLPAPTPVKVSDGLPITTSGLPVLP